MEIGKEEGRAEGKKIGRMIGEAHGKIAGLLEGQIKILYFKVGATPDEIAEELGVSTERVIEVINKLLQG